jgi:hypothetical protein
VQNVGALLSPENDPELATSALGVNPSSGPEAIKPLQNRFHALEVDTSKQDIAATARQMLQGVTR